MADRRYHAVVDRMAMCTSPANLSYEVVILRDLIAPLDGVEVPGEHTLHHTALLRRFNLTTGNVIAFDAHIDAYDAVGQRIGTDIVNPVTFAAAVLAGDRSMLDAVARDGALPTVITFRIVQPKNVKIVAHKA